MISKNFSMPISAPNPASVMTNPSGPTSFNARRSARMELWKYSIFLYKDFNICLVPLLVLSSTIPSKVYDIIDRLPVHGQYWRRDRRARTREFPRESALGWDGRCHAWAPEGRHDISIIMFIGYYMLWSKWYRKRISDSDIISSHGLSVLVRSNNDLAQSITHVLERSRESENGHDL